MPGTDFNIRTTQYVREQAAQAAPAATAAEPSFGFGDLVDIVNPLQHIPVISTIYRHLTGDKIGTPEKIAGDTLYSGLSGLISSVGDAIFTEVTGNSVGDTVYAYVFGDDAPSQTGVAANDTSTPTQPASKSFVDTVYDYLFGNDDAPTTAVTANDNAPASATADTTAVTQAAPWQAAAAYRAGGRLLEAY